MGIVESTTGHTAKGERKVAGIIYLAISIAVVAGVLAAFLMGRHREFDPQNSGNPSMSAPDAPPGQAKPGAQTETP